MKIYQYGVIVLIALLLCSCQDEQLIQHSFTNEQLLAGRIAGTWSNPTEIITPEGVPTEVFGSIRIVFTCDSEGNPEYFLASGCPIVFSADQATWSLWGDEKILISDVTPVDEMQMEVDGDKLRLSFYMGWENTFTGETGEGDFNILLLRQ